MFVDSFKCRKIKPLFLLIACICLFVSVSCIHAADIDGGINNQDTGDFNALNDEEVEIYAVEDIFPDDIGDVLNETPNKKTSHMSRGSADRFIIHNHHPINHNHLANKTHFDNKDKKSDYGFYNSRHSDMSEYEICSYFEKSGYHPKTFDNSHFEKSEFRPRTLDDSHKLCKKSIWDVHKHRGGHHKLIVPNIEEAIKSDIPDQLWADSTNSFKKAIVQDSDLTKKSEPCCCRDCKCGHDCNHDVKIISNGKVIVGNDSVDDVNYSNNAAYNYITSTANEEIIRLFQKLC